MSRLRKVERVFVVGSTLEPKLPKHLTVILLDREPSDTPHYLELVREELIKRLQPTKLWVASIQVGEVQEAGSTASDTPVPGALSIVKI